ncbi:MAG: hypothetical protein GY857_19920 [Desulfobacula sp.]|nr:hypothetical protein [Desulfobacula sp.]
MEKEIHDKAKYLINNTRVMTLAVANNDIPWSSPVYFVFHGNAFYFFSNENSRHIIYAQDKNISASIFQDSDNMDQIFGFQMSGKIEKISKKSLYFLIVKKYVGKFNFLQQIFGSQIIDNKQFFQEKFKSRLYCFHPDQIFLSDNSSKSDKRSVIDLNKTNL